MILIVSYLIVTDIALMAALLLNSRMLKRGFAREKRLLGDIEGLLAALKTTTADLESCATSLERQNDVVRGLLDEKRAAWGLERITK